MSLIPLNPPCIVHEYGCADTTPAGSGGREGEKIWEGRCAGFMVHSWPHVEQTLEIIDKEHQETMQIIPVPGKPIHFGTIRTVELRTSFEVGLLVSWRIVLEAFIDPIYAMMGMSAHGNAQWIPVARTRSVGAGADDFFFFYAWADGILRYCFDRSGGIWTSYLHSNCAGLTFFVVRAAQALAASSEGDYVDGRVIAGRYYRIMISHDDALNPQTYNMDLGIIKDPIDQT